ncbi:MAG: hypothetical protein JWO06_1697 [Bacteroidota bacterium]|nr:hypothetical protein [Bacteroidota bacterium]
MKAFFICLVLILALGACKKKTSSTPTFFLSDFPLKTGNYWIYHFTDYTNNLVDDTFTLKVERIEAISTDSSLVYIYIYNDKVIIDSAVYYFGGNGLTYKGLYQQYSFFGNFHLSLPFSQGSEWVNTPTLDTLKVISYSDKYLVTPDNFSSVFYLYSYYRGPKYLLINEIYFSKGIGIIHKNIQYQDNNNFTNNRTQSYDLIGYQIQ